MVWTSRGDKPSAGGSGLLGESGQPLELSPSDGFGAELQPGGWVWDAQGITSSVLPGEALVLVLSESMANLLTRHRTQASKEDILIISL